MEVFLSLSFVDANFVRQVHDRLPIGVGRFYEKSFDNGELILDAMEKGVRSSKVFVLFASPEGLASPAVNFEIDLAKLSKLEDKNYRILVFPTSPEVSFRDLPTWLQKYWTSQSGWLPTDIARYITTILLEPNLGLSNAAPQIYGRGKDLDQLEQLSSQFLMKNKKFPQIYILGGLTGIGRRTLANLFRRKQFATEANFHFGPVLSLAPNADAADVYRTLRSEISASVSTASLGSDLQAFSQMTPDAQADELISLMKHFWKLGQPVTFATTSGFLEDAGNAKEWTTQLFKKIPETSCLFIITSRLFKDNFISGLGNCLQYRVKELSDGDIRTVMVLNANKLGLQDFSCNEGLLQAIGGHPDIANAAVLLAHSKGQYILEKDPRQLFNIQNTFLGEALSAQVLGETERSILNTLSWLPSVSGDILEKIVCSESTDFDDFISAIERLSAHCLISAHGSRFSISNSIRLMYRRNNVTSQKEIVRISSVLKEAWEKSTQRDEFREDLFESFVFMISLEGKSAPEEVLNLLTPGTLEQVVRSTYNRGKDEDEENSLENAIAWGKIAEQMPMAESSREEILNTVARGQIRLEKFADALATIEFMTARGYRSVHFLKGHLNRRRGQFEPAVTDLQKAVKEKKYRRSAVHELALCYKKLSRFDLLKSLLENFAEMVADSSMFLDFQIGLDIAHGKIVDAERRIDALMLMPDNNGKAERRKAQLLMKAEDYRDALILINQLIDESGTGRFHLITLRCVATARLKDFKQAQADIDYVKGAPGRQNVVQRLEVGLLTEKGEFEAAEKKLREVGIKGNQDWLLLARIFDLRSDSPETGLTERQRLKASALDLKQKHGMNFEYEMDF
ncbi:TIR domain-containing protein [Parasphingorhabdus sp.]|uniref:TIR domain-containing protein n=1 Tax=Parasphingorhabdus sp. TaxID=2709688 RepID=UPI003A944B87